MDLTYSVGATWIKLLGKETAAGGVDILSCNRSKKGVLRFRQGTKYYVEEWVVSVKTEFL